MLTSSAVCLLVVKFIRFFVTRKYQKIPKKWLETVNIEEVNLISSWRHEGFNETFRKDVIILKATKSGHHPLYKKIVWKTTGVSNWPPAFLRLACVYKKKLYLATIYLS